MINEIIKNVASQWVVDFKEQLASFQLCGAFYKFIVAEASFPQISCQETAESVHL